MPPEVSCSGIRDGQSYEGVSVGSRRGLRVGPAESPTKLVRSGGDGITTFVIHLGF